MYLTKNYVAQDEDTTKKEVLQRRVVDYEANKDIPEFKLRRLKYAIGMLATAIALAVAGVSMQMIIQAATK
jgi:hypothetical protein